MCARLSRHLAATPPPPPPPPLPPHPAGHRLNQTHTFFFSSFFHYLFRWYSHHDPFSLQTTAANLKTHSFYPDPAGFPEAWHQSMASAWSSRRVSSGGSIYGLLGNLAPTVERPYGVQGSDAVP